MNATQQSKQCASSTLDFNMAALRLQKVVTHTPLMYNAKLSKQYEADVYLKREDLQVVRSYKLRGAYNMMASLGATRLRQGVVCASAGNHAQGFAFSCQKLGVPGVVFMPVTTPKQKISQTKMFGGDFITIQLVGDNFDECAQAAKEYTATNNFTFIPPFDDYKIIEGQGTVALEILEDQRHVDFVFVPIGGGGLAAGVGAYLKDYSPHTILVGAEPMGAPSMTKALEAGAPVQLATIDNFVDGAAVKKVGVANFAICKEVLKDVVLVEEGKICSIILQLYNEDAIVAEPAGVLSIAALEAYKAQLKGKTVVCIVSGSNNDIARMQEIKERSLLFEKLKHYFIIKFAQRPGALKEFVNEVLGPNDDIVRFEYMQKNNKETGPALIGIELHQVDDYDRLMEKLQQWKINYMELNKDDKLFGYLV